MRSELGPAAVVAEMHAVGYEAVDWATEQFDPLAESATLLIELVELATRHGLRVPQLMVHQDYVTTDPGLWEQRVQRSERAVAAAAIAGVPTIGVVTGPNRWVSGWCRVGAEVTEDLAWDLALRALDRVLAAAEGSGVRVALEPCWGTLAWNAEAADRVLTQFGPELGINLDPSHFVMAGEDPGGLAERWGEHVAHVHLKDAFGRSGLPDEDFCFLLPGEGGTNWTRFLAGLDAVHYDGTLSVEFESFRLRDHALGGDVEAGARVALDFVTGLLRDRMSV